MASHDRKHFCVQLHTKGLLNLSRTGMGNRGIAVNKMNTRSAKGTFTFYLTMLTTGQKCFVYFTYTRTSVAFWVELS